MVKQVETATGQKVKVLRLDNGREYKSAKFKAFTTAMGIDHQFSAPRTLEQNGVAKRDNRTVVEKALTMMAAKRMPKEAWAEAVSCAVYLLNRTPCKKTRIFTLREIFWQKTQSWTCSCIWICGLRAGWC